MPFSSTLVVGLLAMIGGGVLMVVTRSRKAGIALLVAGLVILVASLVVIKLAAGSM